MQPLSMVVDWAKVALRLILRLVIGNSSFPGHSSFGFRHLPNRHLRLVIVQLVAAIHSGRVEGQGNAAIFINRN